MAASRRGRAVPGPAAPPGASRVAREHHVAQALRALHLFQRDQHYVVEDDKVQIVDE